MATSMYKGTKVIELSDRDFTGSRLKKNGAPGLIMFYSASCPFCLNKRDDYISLAEQFNGSGVPDYMILAVDTQSQKSKKINEALEIQGVPTFYSVDEKGRLNPMTEPFEKDAIVVKAYKMIEETDEGAEEEAEAEAEALAEEGAESAALAEEEAEALAEEDETEGVESAALAEEDETEEDEEEPEEESEEEEELEEEEEPEGAPKEEPEEDVEELTVESDVMSTPSAETIQRTLSSSRTVPIISAPAPVSVGGSYHKLDKRFMSKTLKELTLKDLQGLAREFSRPIGRSKAEQIEKLLK